MLFSCAQVIRFDIHICSIVQYRSFLYLLLIKKKKVSSLLEHQPIRIFVIWILSLFFQQNPVLRLYLLVAGQRHHGWGRKNALTREAVAKVVDDTYRKMQVQCAPDLASRSHSGSDFSHFRPKEEATDYYHVETKVRCLCSSTMLNDNMIQCEDAKCQVWQHITCVLIPDKPTEGVRPEVPPHFYCELCRLNRADPYVLLWLLWFTLFPFNFHKSSCWDAQL
jgi:hypothetical protein